jgi:hypothetical protein
MFSWWNYHALAKANIWLTPPPITTALTKGTTMSLSSASLHNGVFISKGWQNLDPYVHFRNTLEPNSNSLWNIPHTGLYAATYLTRYNLVSQALLSDIHENKNDISIGNISRSTMTTLGISNLISPKVVQGTNVTQTKHIPSIYGTLYLYTVSGVTPEAYMTRNIFRIGTLKEYAQQLKNSTPNGNPVTFIEDDLPITKDTNAPQTIMVHKINGTTYEMNIQNNNDASLVVLAKSYAKGWSATIDGKKTPLYPININQIGVVAKKGEHSIQFRYQEPYFRLGAIISLIALLISICAILHPGRDWTGRTGRSTFWL